MNSNQDMAWPSYARIIEETGLSRATVAKYIKVLEAEGWIKRDSGNSTTNTIYFATLPEVISEEVKKIDNTIQEKLKGSSSAKLRSTPAKQGVVRELNTNKQCNKQINNQDTDIFLAENRSVYLDDIKFDHDLRFCQEAIDQLRHINKQQYCRGAHTGSLTLAEWQDCESAMRSVDEFDFEYFTWWMETRSASMRKTPSLPNMLTDMNGIDFQQFYDSTFMQEWE